MCNACGETKPYSEFNRNSETHDGYRYTCKVCRRNKTPTNPEFSRQTRKRQDATARTEYGTRKLNGGSNWSEIKRLSKYGLTVDSFNELLELQSSCCGVCTKPLGDKFCIDHDHETGLVRGLLCYGCNSGLGQLGDSIAGLQRAIAYLRRSDKSYPLGD